jgi:hypothetical protein
MLIYCNSDAARSATLGLVASVMRHLHAEATFVSVQSPTAPRSEVTSSFRRLLDARAELQETHGLDIRTDVQIGDLNSWVAHLAASLGTGAGGARPGWLAAELERDPAQRLPAAVQRWRRTVPVLLSCSGEPSRQRREPRRGHRLAVRQPGVRRSAAEPELSRVRRRAQRTGAGAAPPVGPCAAGGLLQTPAR